MRDEQFELRLGRPRSKGSRRDRNFLPAVLKSAASAGYSNPRRGRQFDGSRIGRGSVAARMLGTGDRLAGLRARRAIVKTRLVRLGGKSLAAAHAHLSYIQRDGVSRDGEPGQLYSAVEDEADGKAFVGRCNGDRHQFRLIVSAEDGAEYEDLKPLIRRFMARMEEDLGTRLDWVAGNHLDTHHPHTHIMLRGKDDRGENLVIAPEYIKHGMRERLSGLVSIDLGPRTDLEIEQRLRLEVHAERLTSLDFGLLRRSDSERLVTATGRDMASHALQTGRLRNLEALGLAEKLEGGKWRLAEDLESTLRRLGERGDIVRTLQRALKAAGVDRTPVDQVVHYREADIAVTGRVVARGLADETRDSHFLIIDGVDGRSHYIDIGKGERTEPLPEGAIVRIAPREIEIRETDRAITAVAAEHGGRYRIEFHLIADAKASIQFVQTHVRRLEAFRRQFPNVERLQDGSWSIPPNFLELAHRYETARVREAPFDVHILSALPLDRLAHHDGATWLDRELISPEASSRDQGFGHEVRSAMAMRRTWLVEQGLATSDGQQFSVRSDLLAALQRRELLHVAKGIAKENGLGFAPIEPGSRVEGVVVRRVDLASGRFALIENSREFSLVPWRPVLERALDRSVSGMVGRDRAISWTLGRERGLEI